MPAVLVKNYLRIVLFCQKLMGQLSNHKQDTSLSLYSLYVQPIHKNFVKSVFTVNLARLILISLQLHLVEPSTKIIFESIL